MTESRLNIIHTLFAFQNINTPPPSNKPDGIAIFIITGVIILFIIIYLFSYRKAKRESKNSLINKADLTIRLKRTGNKDEIKMSIRNQSNKYIEIMPPEIILKGFQLSKKLKVRGNNYPLTISPQSNHLVIFRKAQLLSGNQTNRSPKLLKAEVTDKYKNVFKTRYHLF